MLHLMNVSTIETLPDYFKIEFIEVLKITSFKNMFNLICLIAVGKSGRRFHEVFDKLIL